MTREQYVKYLQNQAYWLEHIAQRIEEGLPVDDYDWLVDIPLQTKFEEPIQLKEAV